MIEVQNLSFSYPGASSKVFDGFQLKLESGHTYGLLGRNGTGKSTLLYLASGLLRPKKGHLYIDGMESAQRKAERSERTGGFPHGRGDHQGRP